MNLEMFDINSHEKKIYSQNGEDGILEFIFSKIGTTNKFSVEFGVGNGFECNTVYLLEKKGWTGLMMDYGADQKIKWTSVLNKAWSNRQLGLTDNLKKDVTFLKKIVKQELKYIASEKLYLLGISQGGTVCINTALSLKFKLGGVICIDTIFLSDYISDISFLKQSFYTLISSKDKIYNPDFQKVCYDLLRFFGNTLNITERNKKHCEDVEEICDYIHSIFTKK